MIFSDLYVVLFIYIIRKLVILEKYMLVFFSLSNMSHKYWHFVFGLTHQFSTMFHIWLQRKGIGLYVV